MVFYTKITSVFVLLLALRNICILHGIGSPLLAMSAAPIPFPFYDFSVHSHLLFTDYHFLKRIIKV